MGTYLSTPVTDKCEESGEAPDGSGDRPMEWGVVDMQGWRKSMEDAHTAVTSVSIKTKDDTEQNARVFGVYDGHGGPEVARFCQHYFVSVLTHQESWVEHSSKDRCLPLEGDDDRVPAAPPAPTDGPYDGDGNEQGYRSYHLPVATETPVGKALRQAFHAMDRMIDDPSRRNEIVTLRTVKPEKGQTKTLENGLESIPNIPSSTETPPDFYTRSQPGAPSATAPEDAKKEEETPVVSTPVGLEGSEAIKQQADRSLSMAMDPEQAAALKNALEEFEENSEDGDAGKTKEEDSVNSNEPVGQEEAAALDDNLDETSDEVAEPASETTSEGSPNGGKVTTMLQKILSLGGTADAAEESAEPQSAPTIPAPPEVLIDPPKYPDSTEITGTSSRVPSVVHNGRLVCNLPDHPIHAGATAVVGVFTGNILTVANAGDSRAVLCRRRKASGEDVAKGHYAYPMSYDHKPSQIHEMNRILRSGGFVNHFGRINGNLNLSRSIGDLKYKQVPGIPPPHQMITAEPDIMQVVLQEDDEFLLFGCDGIWDCLSNEQAVDFVMNRIDTKSPTEIGAEMLDQIISDDPRVTQGIGGDNMTIMIVDLKASTRSRKTNPPPPVPEEEKSETATAETNPAEDEMA